MKGHQSISGIVKAGLFTVLLALTALAVFPPDASRTAAVLAASQGGLNQNDPIVLIPLPMDMDTDPLTLGPKQTTAWFLFNADKSMNLVFSFSEANSTGELNAVIFQTPGVPLMEATKKLGDNLAFILSFNPSAAGNHYLKLTLTSAGSWNGILTYRIGQAPSGTAASTAISPSSTVLPPTVTQQTQKKTMVAKQTQAKKPVLPPAPVPSKITQSRSLLNPPQTRKTQSGPTPAASAPAQTAVTQKRIPAPQTRQSNAAQPAPLTPQTISKSPDQTKATQSGTPPQTVPQTRTILTQSAARTAPSPAIPVSPSPVVQSQHPVVAAIPQDKNPKKKTAKAVIPPPGRSTTVQSQASVPRTPATPDPVTPLVKTQNSAPTAGSTADKVPLSEPLRTSPPPEPILSEPILPKPVLPKPVPPKPVVPKQVVPVSTAPAPAHHARSNSAKAVAPSPRTAEIRHLQQTPLRQSGSVSMKTQQSARSVVRNPAPVRSSAAMKTPAVNAVRPEVRIPTVKTQVNDTSSVRKRNRLVPAISGAVAVILTALIVVLVVFPRLKKNIPPRAPVPAAPLNLPPVPTLTPKIPARSGTRRNPTAGSTVKKRKTKTSKTKSTGKRRPKPGK